MRTITLGILLVLGLTACQENKTKKETAEQPTIEITPPPSDSLIYNMKNFRVDNGKCAEESTCTKFIAQYPSFAAPYTHLDTAVLPLKTLWASAQKFLAEYAEYEAEAEHGWEKDYQTAVLYSDPIVVSTETRYYGYLGGVHGEYYIQLSSFYPNTGKEITLQECLKTDSLAVLNRVGERYFRVARALEVDTKLEDAGFRFDNNQFALNENFAITKTGLKFAYDAYEIAAYVMSSTEFIIPFEDIESLVAENSVLAKVIKK